MEEGLYRIDPKSLKVEKLHTDRNFGGDDLLPGDHGKGAYTGQDYFIVSNNGAGGVLAEWDGSGDGGDSQDWTIVDRNRYTDITSPGGIHGAPHSDSSVWSIGWDHKSVLLNIREADSDRWKRVRLPKSSYTYDADHGWYTEWPRIRDVGFNDGTYLMDMHGTFFKFPSDISADNLGGIRPIARHLKMVVDFTGWQEQIVLACNDLDDNANPIPGMAQSNFVFTDRKKLQNYGGTPAGFGGPLVHDNMSSGETSEPFFIRGYADRTLHLSHESGEPVTVTLEVDSTGKANWESWKTVKIPAEGYTYKLLPDRSDWEWLRVVSNQNIKDMTAYFHLRSGERSTDRSVFEGLARADRQVAHTIGLIRARGQAKNLEVMEFHSTLDEVNEQGEIVQKGYYEMQGDLQLERKENKKAEAWLRDYAETEPYFDVDQASVIIIDGEGNRFRLPKTSTSYDSPTAAGWPRMMREVVTERGLLNVHGTFYELPYQFKNPHPLRGVNFRRVRPIATHNRRIYDYGSWRGFLVMSGVRKGVSPEKKHYINATGGAGALWIGSVDDLWSFPEPWGVGGPWKNTKVTAGSPSDPYLMYGFDQKLLVLSHQNDSAVTFHVEVDVRGDDTWHRFKSLTVAAGEEKQYSFPGGYSAHWVRLVADKDTRATAQFNYNNN